MNRKSLILRLSFFFTLLTLTACSEMGRDDLVADVAEPGAKATSDEAAPSADCAEAAPGTEQLIDAAQGVCFLYPDNYDVSQGTDEAFGLYVSSPLNTGAPLASISYEPADGRSLDELTAQRLNDYAFPDTGPQAVTLGGEPAVMLDNLPGQDTNRRVFTIHNDTVIDLMVARTGDDYGEVGVQAEALYEMLTSSWHFISPVAGAPRQAGPECPAPVANSTLFTNETIGYCLVLPGGYTILQASSDEMEDEMIFYVDSVQDTSHPRLSVKVTEAGNRSLEKITKAYETEIEKGVPGYDVQWSFGYMLDGEPANQFDQVPGQDLSRQVLMVHDGQLFTLTFTPDEPNAGAAYDEMQILYDMVVKTFSLFPPR